MTDEEKYLFDVAGYLVVDDVLSRDHCQRLVDALHEIISTPRDQLLTGVGHRESESGEISVGDLPSIGPLFADLIDLPPVMEDHIHLIASSPDLSRNVRRFLSFTARQLIDHLTDSEETAHLRVLEQNRLDSRKSHRYRVWRPGFHPQALLSNSMMDQKISYIHENPVRKGLVQRAEDWPYSSLAFLKGATHLPPVEQAIF